MGGVSDDLGSDVEGERKLTSGRTKKEVNVYTDICYWNTERDLSLCVYTSRSFHKLQGLFPVLRNNFRQTGKSPTLGILCGAPCSLGIT